MKGKDCTAWLVLSFNLGETVIYIIPFFLYKTRLEMWVILFSESCVAFNA